MFINSHHFFIYRPVKDILISFRFDEQVTLAKLWVKKFIKCMDKLVTNQTDVAFSYYNAMEKEVQKSATAEAHLFPLTFVMMIIYASIATIINQINQNLYLIQLTNDQEWHDGDGVHKRNTKHTCDSHSWHH
jgi:hypothetical protein